MAHQIFSRIYATPEILGGKPCIKGTRLSVQFILELIASGASVAEILRSYQHITAEDIQECLQYAARFLANEVVVDVAIMPIEKLPSFSFSQNRAA